MRSAGRFRLVCWGLLLVGASVAPGSQEPRPKESPAPRKRARYPGACQGALQGGAEAVRPDLGVLRAEPSGLDRGLHLVATGSRRPADPATRPEDRVPAIEDHLNRMKALEELVTRIRRIGFGRSSDVERVTVLPARGRVLAGRGEGAIEFQRRDVAGPLSGHTG